MQSEQVSILYSLFVYFHTNKQIKKKKQLAINMYLPFHLPVLWLYVTQYLEKNNT